MLLKHTNLNTLHKMYLIGGIKTEMTQQVKKNDWRVLAVRVGYIFTFRIGLKIKANAIDAMKK